MHYCEGLRKLRRVIGQDFVVRQDVKYSRTVFERCRVDPAASIPRCLQVRNPDLDEWLDWRRSLPDLSDPSSTEGPNG